MMSNLNRLHRFKELLWARYDDRIRDEEDWFYKCWGWEINFVENNDQSSCVAYRIKDGTTDWSDYIILEKYVKEWRKVV